jgi:hypothetical protein
MRDQFGFKEQQTASRMEQQDKIAQLKARLAADGVVLDDTSVIERGLLEEGEDFEVNLNMGRRRYPDQMDLIMHNPFWVPSTGKKKKKKKKGKK